ncbi:cell death abnormality protein 1-like [Saccostrea cucullata]|uniref:cell death abnormality protein 1-like n=1 Tax=Saccostrea cuccullata TaxID=36930 RepID=UPI002ED456D2
MKHFFFALVLVTQINFQCCKEGKCIVSFKGCCPDTIWDQSKGECVDCPLGFFGEFCNESCHYPFYGKYCKDKCNCGNQSCDNIDGCIDNECPFGYIGINCSQTCQYPNFGKGCKEVCRCDRSLCDFATGCHAGEGENLKDIHVYMLIFGITLVAIFIAYIAVTIANKYIVNNNTNIEETDPHYSSPAEIAHINENEIRD